MLKTLLNRATRLAKRLAQLRAALTRLQSVSTDAAAAVDQLAADNPGYLRLVKRPAERAREIADFEREYHEARRVAAGVLLYDVTTTWPALEADIRSLREQSRQAPPPITAYLARTGGQAINLTASAETLSRAHDRIVSAVFHRADGLPIKSFRKAWATACKEAGYPTMLVHDFRRSAVRNLERAGVPRSTAMQMVGHKTEAVYRRYAVVDEASHREGGEKYGAFADGRPATKLAATVRPFRRRAAGGAK